MCKYCYSLIRNNKDNHHQFHLYTNILCHITNHLELHTYKLHKFTISIIATIQSHSCNILLTNNYYKEHQFNSKYITNLKNLLKIITTYVIHIKTKKKKLNIFKRTHFVHKTQNILTKSFL